MNGWVNSDLAGALAMRQRTDHLHGPSDGFGHLRLAIVASAIDISSARYRRPRVVITCHTSSWNVRGRRRHHEGGRDRPPPTPLDTTRRQTRRERERQHEHEHQWHRTGAADSMSSHFRGGDSRARCSTSTRRPVTGQKQNTPQQRKSVTLFAAACRLSSMMRRKPIHSTGAR